MDGLKIKLHFILLLDIKNTRKTRLKVPNNLTSVGDFKYG